MGQIERETNLPSIHYNETTFSDFLDRIEEINDIKDIKIRVHWNNGDSATYASMNELVRDTNIPDRLLRFTIHLTAERGRIFINADGGNGREIHSIRLNGERDWVYMNLSHVNEFVDLRKNWFGENFSRLRISFLQAFIFGSMASLVGDYLILLAIPALIPAPLSTEIIILSIGLVFLIVLLQISKYLYPYVVLRKREAEPLYKKAVVAGSVLLGIASSTITLLNFALGLPR